MNASNDRIARSNPTRMADKHINALATGRNQEIELILRTVRANRDTPSAPNEHLLIRGQHGMGKSFLLRLSQVRLKEEPGVVFVLLPEELPNVHSPEAWLTEVHNRLSSNPGNPNLAQWQYQENANAWEQRLQQILRCLEQEQAKTLLLVGVENIDRLLANAFKGKAAQSCLRHLLENEKRIMLLASSQDHHLDHDYDARLFHNFHSLTLAPWQASEHIAYLNACAQHAQLNPGTTTISAIQAYSHFTDGSPRIAAVLTNMLLNQNDARSSTTHLPALVDAMSEYYQGLQRRIPPQAAKLFDALLRGGEPCSQSELARRVGAQQNQISRHFVWLRDHGYISALERVKGQSSIRYQVRDRLFAQFYRMRFFDRDRDHNPLPSLIDLLADCYKLSAPNARISWRATGEAASALWDKLDSQATDSAQAYGILTIQQLASTVCVTAEREGADAALATASELCRSLRARKYLPQEPTLRIWLAYWLLERIDTALLRRLSALISAEFAPSMQASCTATTAAIDQLEGISISPELDPDLVTTAKALGEI